MGPDKRAVAVALAASLILAGCGKPPSQSPPVADEPTAPANAEVEPPTPSAELTPATATNETLSGGGGFARKSLASVFAQTGQALKESYDSALIAFQIGDYGRAVRELDLLAKTPGLTPEQKQAVQELLGETLKAAPELANAEPPSESSVAAPGAAEPSPATTTNETRPGGGEFTLKSLASPFAQADRAIKESYDSALVAVQIGDYDRAVSELKVLAANPDLTPEQVQAVRSLLGETLKPTPELAPTPGAAATDGAKPQSPP